MRWSLLPCLVCATATAQTVQELRDQLASSLSGGQIRFVSGLLDLSENTDLAATRLDVGSDPELVVKTIKVPWRRDVAFAGDLSLQVEAGLGYLHAEGVFQDIWGGLLPGQETEVRGRWEGWSAYCGAGPRFALAEGLHLTPLLDLSLAYVTSDGDYAGPGAVFSRSLLDGILFDWHITELTWGGALALDHRLAFGDGRWLTSLVRYDLRSFDAVHASDDVPTERDSLQRLVARVEHELPTGISIGGRDLRCNQHVTYLRFLGHDADEIGFFDYFELGLGLVLPYTIGPANTFSLSPVAIVGEDVTGWSIGGGVTF